MYLVGVTDEKQDSKRFFSKVILVLGTNTFKK